jgi:hypothetical protein
VGEDLAAFNSEILVEFGELNQYPLIAISFLNLIQPHYFPVSTNFECLNPIYTEYPNFGAIDNPIIPYSERNTIIVHSSCLDSTNVSHLELFEMATYLSLGKNP